MGHVQIPEILDEYRALREQGFNPAYEFDRFRDLLSYGFAFGENADTVRGRLRENTETMETVTRVLFRPGDWPLPPESRRQA